MKEKFYKFYKLYFPKLFNILFKNIHNIFLKSIGKKSFVKISFPIGEYGEIAFFQYPFLKIKNSGDEYFGQFYSNEIATDYTIDKRMYAQFDMEILKGKLINNTSDLFVTDKSLLPVSLPNNKTDMKLAELKLTIKDKSYYLEKLKHNSFHYLPIEANSLVKIESNQKFVLCEPIPLEQTNTKPKKKLVMTIFIDGLSSHILNTVPFEEIMPNIHKFFNNGTKFLNCFANAEWTVPSLPTLFSGLYTRNHQVFHPKENIFVGETYKLLSEYFQDEGYLTTQICSNHRKNPSYNYVKGFNRSIYKKNMSCDDIIMKTLEHLRTFNKRSNYMWLSFFELHHFLNGMPDISSQSANSLLDHNYDIPNEKSVSLSFNEKQMRWYINELKRLDFYLKILFDFISENYKEEEIVISIVSDHGQAYLGEQKDLLSEQKIKIPMMFKAKNANHGVRNEYIENVDYLPSLLKLAEIDCEIHKINGKLPNILGGQNTRQYIFSESIFPNKHYEAVIYDDFYIIYAKSKNKILTTKDLDMTNFSYTLLQRANYLKIEENDMLFSKYKSLLIQHIHESVL